MKKGKKWITILNLFGIKSLDEYDAVLKKLQEGVDINTVDSDGRTLLMQAVAEKNHTLIKLLIDNGADINIQDKRKWTALHFAAQRNDLDSTKLLIQNGADVNAQNDYGNSIISTAVFYSRGRRDVIQLLKSQGADINIKNKSEISALDLAQTISNYDLLPFLVDT